MNLKQKMYTTKIQRARESAEGPGDLRLAPTEAERRLRTFEFKLEVCCIKKAEHYVLLFYTI